MFLGKRYNSLSGWAVVTKSGQKRNTNQNLTNIKDANDVIIVRSCDFKKRKSMLLETGSPNLDIGRFRFSELIQTNLTHLFPMHPFSTPSASRERVRSE